MKEERLSPIQVAVQHALANEHDDAILTLSHSDAQAALDYVWMLMGFPSAQHHDVPEVYQTHEARMALRRLSLKLALKYDMFPSAMVIKGVVKLEEDYRSFGGFASVYVGKANYRHVALKRLHLYELGAAPYQVKTRHAFYQESMLWKHLSHDHVVSFLGVSEDVFKNTICMVSPWMFNGSLRGYIPDQRKKGMLSEDDLPQAIDNWLHQTALGLAYLHGEGIVHGDLHGGNILVDNSGRACLTDFGMSVVVEAALSQEGSGQKGGHLCYLAPELIDPETFGMDNTRPTRASDVYAFGCTAVELYTGRLPFSPEILNPLMVMRRVVQGHRPPRPTSPRDLDISDDLWNVIIQSWTQIASTRPSASEVATSLKEIMSPTANESGRLRSPDSPIARIRSPAPSDAYTELMNERPETEAEKEHFYQRALAEGEKQVRAGPAYYKKAARIFHKALQNYSSQKELREELLMIYGDALPPEVLKLVQAMME